MRKGSVVIAFAVLVLVGTGTVGAGASGVAPAKKRCHFVKKKVHGKVKRVRVCTKPKPKPKPAKATNLTLTLDDAHAAIATVGAAGANVDLRTASGAHFTLSIPAGALAEDTAITVTPVSRVRGLPAKVGLVSGVQFGPDGLGFATPATLVIDGKVGTSALAWFGDGRDAHRYPQLRTSSGAELRVTHFSGVGTVNGPSSLLPDARTALTAEFARYVRPLLRRAETDDSAMEEAFGRAFAWEHDAGALGLLDEFPTFRREIRSSLEKAIPNAMRRADERCRSHDLTQLGRMLRIQRFAELADVALPSPSTSDRVARCARFELDLSFEATTEKINDIGPAHSEERTALQVKAEHVPLSVADSFLELSGEGPLTLMKWEYRLDVTVSSPSGSYSCSVHSLPGHATDSLRARLKVGVRSGGQVELTLSLDPGDVVTPVDDAAATPHRSRRSTARPIGITCT